MAFPLSVASNQLMKSNVITTTIAQGWRSNTGIRFAVSGILGNTIFFGLDKLLLPIILEMADGNSRNVLFALRKSDASLKWIRRNAESISFFVAYLLDIIVQRKYGCTHSKFAIKLFTCYNLHQLNTFIFILRGSVVYSDFINALLVFGLDTIKTRELYLSSLATAYTAYFTTLCGSTILQAYLLQHGVSKNAAFWGTIAIGSLVNFAVLTTLDARAKSKPTTNKI